MPAAPVNLLNGTYDDITKPLSAQETINWIPEVVETQGARSVMLLRGAPGLTTFKSGLNGKIRGMWVMNSKLYVVSGFYLYRISEEAVATQIGYINGTNRVDMSDNGVQLCIVNGDKGYVYTESSNTLVAIGDIDFPGSYSVTFLDQYMIFSGINGQFFLSAISDATDFDALDFATAESSPDPVLQVFADHLELWVFGSQTIEIWNDTGNPDFPFERNTGVVIERGLGARYTVAKVDNAVVWLGEDGSVYRAQQYTPVRISTHPIEQDIQSQDYSDAFAFSYRDRGHWYYVLTLSNGKTWCYDASSQLWHRRKSYGLERWRASSYAFCYGKHLIGDYNAGTIWEMREDVYKEGDEPLVAERKTQYQTAEQLPVFCHSVEILFDTGHGYVPIADEGGELMADQDAPLAWSSGNSFIWGSSIDDDLLEPKVDLRYSDDGGRNFCNFKMRSLGRVGEYRKRIRYHHMGRFLNRVIHFRVSSDVQRNVIAATMNTNVGAYT